MSKAEIDAINQKRSKRAITVDKQKHAKKTENDDVWRKKPGRYDRPGSNL